MIDPYQSAKVVTSSVIVGPYSYLVTATLEFHQSGSYCGILLRHVHQPRLVLDGVELEQDLLVQLDSPLEDANQDLKSWHIAH